MSALIFRRMQESDLDAVLAIEFSAFSHPWTRGIFLDCIKSGHECWLAFDGLQQIGHGVLSAAAGESHLLNITIRPESQGNGFGHGLLEHLMQQAKVRDAEVTFLEVRESNLNAAGLYESFGFNEIGRRRNYYPAVGGREDALVMAYSLVD
ncbi:ribosomal protein S18-alanine N-acetyltransferase [Pseudomonas neustonica]|uniref:ribosomal protein S18-alanine N-acetyltransferase n=1 Tax=Pseudomonas TaxID=286 RepID=UPI0015F4CCF9|nr:ribosomal protein S18-alanine N-acetyltransferase [Pseudomonas sp. 5Ae-yellow]MBA6421790.1 ribosomal protein S18-alanine N-acetyltransferase [Pseudomonas sp. 5Ae-yellow]|tara:strand:- start:194 stop:646 length:453 start_codon:yes stop_codon:yes gene_type:complete